MVKGKYGHILKNFRMNKEPFLQPRLIGPRFEGHAIPLEFLKDLAVLEEMIVEVAKSQFRKENPKRQRIPRNFTEGIELKLTGVEEGSTILVIGLFISSSFLFPPAQTYFEEARNAIISGIDAAEQNKSITDYLPEKALGYFDRIGRSLREGEAIEFPTSKPEKPVRLTKETRRKLILASSQIKELTEEASVRGTIPEADQGNMTFTVQLINGRKIRCPMGMHSETILEALNHYKKDTRVLLKGIGKFDRNERLQGFESIEHINILDDLDVPARLDELRELREGWLEGKGKVPTAESLDWFASAFEHNFPDDLPLPFIYPTPEGGIQAEWSLDSYEVTWEIDLDQHKSEWHALNMQTDDEVLQSLDLDKPKDWKWIADQIRQLPRVTE